MPRKVKITKPTEFDIGTMAYRERSKLGNKLDKHYTIKDAEIMNVARSKPGDNPVEIEKN